MTLTEKVVSEGQASPFILIAGTAGDESLWYYICCKQKVLLELKPMMEAVLVLQAVFHTFDRECTKGISVILIFINKHAFGFTTEGKTPM